MGFREAAARHDHIVRQLNEERALTLARIGRTLESLIGQLRAAATRLAHAGPEDRAQALARHRELRQQALRYRWYLEVQREALGLRWHGSLDEFYEIPPPIEP